MAAPIFHRASLHPAASRWIELWNGKQALGWDYYGTPVFRFRRAPAGLATRRQLRADAHVSRSAGAVRAAGVARRQALGVAVPARPRPPVPHPRHRPSSTPWTRPCKPGVRASSARPVTDYCIPTSDGRCNECITPRPTHRGTDPPRGETSHEPTHRHRRRGCRSRRLPAATPAASPSPGPSPTRASAPAAAAAPPTHATRSGSATTTAPARAAVSQSGAGRTPPRAPTLGKYNADADAGRRARRRRRGWPVFMLGRSKRPVANCQACRERPARPGDLWVPDLPRLLRRHAPTRHRITAMLAAVPGGLLAVRTGAVSGLVVVDIDPRTRRQVSLPDLMPPTCPATRGPHRLRRLAPVLPPPRPLPRRDQCRTPGIDIKADGGYVVATTHRSTPAPAALPVERTPDRSRWWRCPRRWSTACLPQPREAASGQRPARPSRPPDAAGGGISHPDALLPRTSTPSPAPRRADAARPSTAPPAGSPAWSPPAPSPTPTRRRTHRRAAASRSRPTATSAPPSPADSVTKGSPQKEYTATRPAQPDQVNGAALLDAVAATLTRYVVLPTPKPPTPSCCGSPPPTPSRPGTAAPRLVIKAPGEAVRQVPAARPGRGAVPPAADHHQRHTVRGLPVHRQHRPTRPPC